MDNKRGRKIIRVIVDGKLPCTKCRQLLPVSEFARDGRKPCGYKSACQVCFGKRINRARGLMHGCRRRPIVNEGFKWCYACNIVLCVSSFAPNKRRKDGLSSECKACGSRLDKMYREKKRIAELAASTTASIDECVHHLRTPKCRHVKPKKIEAEFACLNCGLLSRRKGGKYCSVKCATLVVWRVQKHVRRARKKGVQREAIDLPTLLARDNFRCGLCAKKISIQHRYPHPLSPSIDHIIPLSKGGSHTWTNVQASHHECNQLKRTQTMGQLRIC